MFLDIHLHTDAQTYVYMYAFCFVYVYIYTGCIYVCCVVVQTCLQRILFRDNGKQEINKQITNYYAYKFSAYLWTNMAFVNPLRPRMV